MVLLPHMSDLLVVLRHRCVEALHNAADRKLKGDYYRKLLLYKNTTPAPSVVKRNDEPKHAEDFYIKIAAKTEVGIQNYGIIMKGFPTTMREFKGFVNQAFKITSPVDIYIREYSSIRILRTLDQLLDGIQCTIGRIQSELPQPSSIIEFVTSSGQVGYSSLDSRTLPVDKTSLETIKNCWSMAEHQATENMSKFNNNMIALLRQSRDHAEALNTTVTQHFMDRKW